jgi:hypothetical protein
LWILLRQDGIFPVDEAVVDVMRKGWIDIRGGDAYILVSGEKGGRIPGGVIKKGESDDND